jgi:CO dehydrogenase/acetyl-CoA synthase alpha subunit
MIKIIKGSYGMRRGSSVQPVLAGSDPIELSKEQEERLVRLGVAVYVTEEDTVADLPDVSDETQDDEIVDEFPEYNEDMKLSELKEIAKVYGIDARSMKSKKEVIEAIDAARDELPDVDADALVE